MNLERKVLFNNLRCLYKWLNSKNQLDVLDENDRETIFSNLVTLDSVSSDLLAYIVIKTKKKETIEAALSHPKVLVDWCGLILNASRIGDNHIIDFKFILDEVTKQFDEIIEMEDGYTRFLDIVDKIVFKTFYLEVADVGYCDNLFNTILDYMEKKLNEEDLVKLSKETFLSSEELDFEGNCLDIFINILNEISVHPQCSINTSNRVISIIEKLEEICRNSSEIEREFIEKNKDFSQYLNLDYHERIINLFKKNQLSIVNEDDELIGHYSYTQAFSNAVLYAMQRDSAFQWKNQNDNILVAVVDFIYDSNTTVDMIKKVLLDKSASFVHCEKVLEKETFRYDKRIETLFKAIVNDERFEQNKLPYELLNNMIRMSRESDVILKCLKKSNFVGYNSLILNRLSEGVIYIFEFNVVKIPDDFFIEIAKKCKSVRVLGDMLSCAEYCKIPRECVEIIWERRGEFSNRKWDEEVKGAPRSEIYCSMFGCKYATKDILKESLEEIVITSQFPIAEMSKIILNLKCDYEILKLFQDRLTEEAKFLGKEDVIFLFNDWMNIEELNEKPIEYANKIKARVFRNIKDMDEVVSKIIICCFYYYEEINQESVIQFLLQFGDRSKNYIVAYQHLLNIISPIKRQNHGKK